jgi:hypothetical protein
MMSVLDKVNVSDPDQLYCRQYLPATSRLSDAQPAYLVMILKRIEVTVKVVAAPLATLDLADGYALYPGTATARSCATGFNFSESEQMARVSGQC